MAATTDMGCRKFFISHLSEAEKETSNWSWKGLPFIRVWGQIYEIVKENQFIINDGTGALLIRANAIKEPIPWEKKVGMYVMVIGGFALANDKNPCVIAHQLINLSETPNREELWKMEVEHIHKYIYEQEIQI